MDTYNRLSNNKIHNFNKQALLKKIIILTILLINYTNHIIHASEPAPQIAASRLSACFTLNKKLMSSMKQFYYQCTSNNPRLYYLESSASPSSTSSSEFARYLTEPDVNIRYEPTIILRYSHKQDESTFSMQIKRGAWSSKETIIYDTKQLHPVLKKRLPELKERLSQYEKELKESTKLLDHVPHSLELIKPNIYFGFAGTKKTAAPLIIAHHPLPGAKKKTDVVESIKNRTTGEITINAYKWDLFMNVPRKQPHVNLEIAKRLINSIKDYEEALK